MQCYACDNSATLSCPRCGRAACNMHQLRNNSYSSTLYICYTCSQEVNSSVAEVKAQQEARFAQAKAQEEARIRQQKEADRCRSCNGSGGVSTLFGLINITCERCEGSGSETRARQIEQQKQEEERQRNRPKCSKCGGTGQAPVAWGLLGTIDCENCAGTGYLDYSPHARIRFEHEHSDWYKNDMS
jgi:DnaJ-class molecular chaperone